MDSLNKVAKVDILLESMKFCITLNISLEFLNSDKGRSLERIRIVHESHAVARNIRDETFISRVRNIACFLFEHIVRRSGFIGKRVIDPLSSHVFLELVHISFNLAIEMTKRKKTRDTSANNAHPLHS